MRATARAQTSTGTRTGARLRHGTELTAGVDAAYIVQKLYGMPDGGGAPAAPNAGTPGAPLRPRQSVFPITPLLPALLSDFDSAFPFALR